MISGFWQTDYALLRPVRSYGCALLSAMYLAPVDFTITDVNEMYKSLLSVKFVDEECTVRDWQSVLNSISPHFAFKTRTTQQYVCLACEREILKWWLSNVEEHHFTVGNGSSMTVWDSMNRPDIMSKYATFVEKVVVRTNYQGGSS